jgi:sterol desaturase/sphingolipid hydroxylase (fatty acid hydroxylase superfamily)
MSMLIYYAIPFFVVTMLLELLAIRGRPSSLGYETRDSVASLSMGIGNVMISAVVKTGLILLYVQLSRFALFDIGYEWWAWVLLIVLEDLCYYWFHRLHHEVRFMWAAHINHHSSRHYNLSTALRQSWTTPFTGPIFWVPLVLLGFKPEMILAAQAISLLYQYWIHTELIDRLGPFEWILNTPSHHRVHHGRNPQYLDRNYAGIFIVWDRLFGSFEPEAAPVDYGITKNLTTFNPVRIAFHEWIAMLRDCRQAGGLADRLRILFHPPGWTPDGSGLTAADLRARLEAGHAESAQQTAA